MTVMGLSDDDVVFGVGSNASFAIAPIKYKDQLGIIPIPLNK
ncbi:MAG: hypothetical protein ACI8SK_001311 [Shewanella sp.]|jgi:hypothetical protein